MPSTRTLFALILVFVALWSGAAQAAGKRKVDDVAFRLLVNDRKVHGKSEAVEPMAAFVESLKTLDGVKESFKEVLRALDVNDRSAFIRKYDEYLKQEVQAGRRGSIFKDDALFTDDQIDALFGPGVYTKALVALTDAGRGLGGDAAKFVGPAKPDKSPGGIRSPASALGGRTSSAASGAANKVAEGIAKDCGEPADTKAAIQRNIKTAIERQPNQTEAIKALNRLVDSTKQVDVVIRRVIVEACKL